MASVSNKSVPIESVLLNNVDHHDLKIRPGSAGETGSAVNQVLVLPTEFEAVQREFPIILREDSQGKIRPVALLGLAQGQNAFLDAAGNWTSAHVPLMVQRGPFSIVAPEHGNGDPMIQVDLADPRLSREEGAPLFLPHGGQAPYLQKMADVLRAIWLGHQLLDPMVAAFSAAGLLRPVNLELRTGEHEVFAIANAITVDRERLAGLDGAALEKLNREGFLQSAFMIAASLGNVQALVNRHAARLAMAAAA
ncbi:SapC family protein [Alteraurantiacibacter buctensis]|uniref:Peptide ABC transporter permease n=1 Tax=Alteraurantiacibacter buctensis TaxID=1503981 RepID=A0A844YT17_9SPHN|nr:SapC family protein [Alteraurantiacibacter buctensis]MXO70689.1 peptide ABC transporter permease [Alteraurantiacibacter buctensis]